MTSEEKPKTSLPKNEFEKAMKICFSYTKKEYLSYGDFEFLLNKKGRIGQTVPIEKKKLYKQWEKDLHFKSSNIDYPYRKFEFMSSRFKEVANSLINDKKLKKTKIGKKPYYFLPKQVERSEILRIEHQNVVSDISNNLELGGKRCSISFYGTPRLYYNIASPQVLKIRKKFQKLGINFEKLTDQYLELICEISSLKLKEIFEEIKSFNCKEKDKKLAFLFLFTKDMNEKALERLDQKISDSLLNFIGKNVPFESLFRWTGDGQILEYIPNQYILPTELSKMLHSYLKTEQFWKSKLIVINPQVDAKIFLRFQKIQKTDPIQKEIIKYLKNH